MNEIINNLKNELEINEKKIEMNNNKFNNLQIKYLKLFQQKRRIENESLLKMSKDQLLNKRKNNYSTQKKNLIINNINEVNNNDKNNDIVQNLPLINDVNSSLSISKKTTNRLVKKKENINIKESYSMTNNNE